MRPERLVVALGTATAVGKTWVGAAVLAALRRRGAAVAARKPVQSFGPGDGPTDAHVLAAATGEGLDDICAPHRWYGVAMAPPMAAEALGRAPFTVADLVGELRWPEATAAGWVETAGGPRSPIAADGDCAALAAALAPDLTVLVADAGLGVINAVRLSTAAVVRRPVVVFLNRYDGSDLHVRNRRWLETDGYDLVVDPAALAARLYP